MIGDKLMYRVFNHGDLSKHFILNLNVCLVIEKGAEGDCMYIILQGNVSVYANEPGVLTCTLHENQIFGERAIDKNEARVATVIANVDRTICLALRKKDYKDILYVSNHDLLTHILFVIACADLVEE
jgi:CRP-like cAMP-binding protein